MDNDSYYYALATTVFSLASVYTGENVGFIVALIGATFTFTVFVFKKINSIVKSYENLGKTVNRIEKEVKTNGGSSLKDTVISMKTILNRIEISQKVIEQRTKSSLHCYEQALFEVDQEGKLTWANDKFLATTACATCNFSDYDWVSIITEEDREDFIKELNSCLSMSRKLEFHTTINDKKTKIVGHPYKIDSHSNAGFLFKLISE